MAAKKDGSVAGGDAGGIVAVEVDGVELVVNLGYVRSWKGVRQMGRMVSTELPEMERFAAMTSYYESAIDNMDAVTEEAGDLSAKEVFALFSRAVKAATPKN